MTAAPSVHAAHGRRWALWLFMFVGVVLHSSLCPPNGHAGVLRATAKTCVSPAAGAPPSGGRSVAAVDTGRTGAAGGPCAPAPGPHRHAPCGVMTHRAAPQDRSARRCRMRAGRRPPEVHVLAAAGPAVRGRPADRPVRVAYVSVPAHPGHAQSG